MYEIPILQEMLKGLHAIGLVVGLMLPLMIVLVIQNVIRNRLLRLILRTLELNPEVKFERRLAAAERRTAR